MSSESNKYVVLKVKNNTRQQLKIASAKKGSKSMDEYIQGLLSKDFKPINEEIKKKQFKKKGGFSLGF